MYRHLLTTSVLSTGLLLVACGGGNDTPATDNPRQANITSVSANQLIHGRQSNFIVKGSNIDQGLSISSNDCDNITNIAGGSSNQQQFSCIPKKSGNISINIAATGLNTPYQHNTIAAADMITNVSSTSLMLFKNTTFTVAGTNLDSNLKVSSNQCKDIVILNGGSATEQKFSCTPQQVGNITFALLATGQSNPHINQQVIPTPQVTITTNKGNMVVELDPVRAPISVANFLQYVNDDFYNGLIFHRVISTFMIQGGGFNENLVEKTTRPPIILESGNGLKNDRGTIAMARTSVPNSATSQFFINVVNNDFLNGSKPGEDGYAVFGKVTSGLDTADTIKAVATSTQGGMQDVPTSAVIISDITQTR